MVLATGSYTVNDTMMKLATAGLPPYEVLMLRGVAATVIGLPLLLLMGYGRDLPRLADRWVLLRSLGETLGVLCWMTALTHMPIADATALGQITPLLVLLGSSLLFRERIGGVRMALIGLGFAGALLVAQPSMQGISLYALLALANAVLCAARDIAGRRVSGAVPGMIVAYCAVLMVTPAAAAMHLATEHWVVPDWPNAALLVGAGVFVIFGHLLVFMAYRIGPTAAVAPFYYCFTLWAVISGAVVFGALPNLLALCGIVLVAGSGIAVVSLGRRKEREYVAA